MVGFTPRANIFLAVSQRRRFAAQNDKEIEGLGRLFGICSEFARNLPGICSELGVRSEFARKSLRKRPGPAMRGTLHWSWRFMQRLSRRQLSSWLHLLLAWMVSVACQLALEWGRKVDCEHSIRLGQALYDDCSHALNGLARQDLCKAQTWNHTSHVQFSIWCLNDMFLTCLVWVMACSLKDDEAWCLHALLLISVLMLNFVLFDDASFRSMTSACWSWRGPSDLFECSS